MNSKNIVALKDTEICMKCLKKKATHTYKIQCRGYGSRFDNFNSYFQLCDDCHDDKYDTWVNEFSSGYDENGEFIGEEYEHEEEIAKFIESLPLESQELFENRFLYGACANYNMDSQDWIDFKLDELPHEKCKEYGFYSPQEKLAYSERFPKCANVKLKIYRDGSGCCECDRGVFGNKDGTAYDYCQSDKCYMCASYSPRNGDIEVVKEVDEYYKNEKDRLIHMLEYAKTRLEELEKDVVKYIENHDN